MNDLALSPDDWHLVSKQNPGAQSLRWEDLVGAGLVLVGLYALLKTLR